MNLISISVIDGSFSCVVKTQKRWSNKIYKRELTKIRYKNQVMCKYLGSTESTVDFNYRVDLVKLRFKRGFKEVKIRSNEWK